MNIQELIEELEYLVEQHGEETEVRFASQPSWPFEYSIDRIEAVAEEECEYCDGEGCENCGGSGESEDGTKVVYLAEGRQIGYLPGSVKERLGW